VHVQDGLRLPDVRGEAVSVRERRNRKDRRGKTPAQLRKAVEFDITVPRCVACASTDCPGIRDGIDACPLWREAEARNARGEYLPTYPLGGGL
jgi:hypothetical protein